jgi:hypothetical protein
MTYNSEEVRKIIEIGIEKGKKTRRRSRMINSSVLIVLILLSSLSITVNVSKTFAEALMDIPILGDIVELITIGSGFEEVAEQGLYKSGNILNRTDDYSLVIEGYYFSDSDVNVLISVEGDIDVKSNYFINNLIIMNENNEKLDVNIENNMFFKYKGSQLRTEIVISREEFLPNTINIEFDVERSRNSSTVYPNGTSHTINEKELIFSCEKYQLQKHVDEEVMSYEIDKLIRLNGVNVHLKSMAIHQTTIDLELDVLSEDYVFYDFEGLKIISKEKEYPLISNGTYRTGNVSDGFTYYFESSYFDKVDDFELIIDGINMLPINSSTIVVDLENNELLKTIDDQIILKEISQTGSKYVINFETSIDVKVSKYDNHDFDLIHFSHESTKKIGDLSLRIDKSLLDDKIIEIYFEHYPVTVPIYEVVDLMQ